jgi:hypothetical protein
MAFPGGRRRDGWRESCGLAFVFAGWAGEVEDDVGNGGIVGGLGVEFLVDGGEGAELEAVDIGHDAGVARGDAAFDEEDEEAGEEVVDLRGGLEVGEKAGEGGGEVGGAVVEAVLLEGGMAEAEAGAGVEDRETAAAAGAGDVAAGGMGGDGVWFSHIEPRLDGQGVYPGRGMGKSPEGDENEEVNGCPWGKRACK